MTTGSGELGAAAPTTVVDIAMLDGAPRNKSTTKDESQENADRKSSQRGRHKSRRESQRHSKRTGTDGVDNKKDGIEDNAIEHSGEFVPTGSDDEARKRSSSAHRSSSKNKRPSSRRNLKDTADDGKPDSDVFIALKDEETYSNNNGGEDSKRKRSGSSTRLKNRTADNGSGDLELSLNVSGHSKGSKSGKDKQPARSHSSRHRRTVDENAGETNPVGTQMIVRLNDDDEGNNNNEEKPKEMSRRRSRKIVDDGDDQPTTTNKEEGDKRRSSNRKADDYEESNKEESAELSDRDSSRKQRSSSRRSSHRHHGSRKRSSSKRRKDGKRKSKSRKSKRQRARDFISSSASLFSRSTNSRARRTAPHPLFPTPEEQLFYNDDDTIDSHRKEDHDHEDDENGSHGAAGAPKLSCWQAAWQKTWFRVLMAFLGIGIAVLITYLIMRFTGLGLEETNDTSGSNGSANGGGTNNNGPSMDVSPSPTPALTEEASLVPTAEVTPLYKYPPPDEATCRAFVNGPNGFAPGFFFLPDENDGEGSITLDFDFNFEVTLRNMTPQQEEQWLEDFQNQIMISLLPLLVGCLDGSSTFNRRLDLLDTTLPSSSLLRHSEAKSVQSIGHPSRKLQDSDQSEIRYVIQNAQVIDTIASESPCPENPRQNPADDPSCYLVTVILELSLKGEERIFPVLSLLANILGEFADIDEGASEGGGGTSTSTLVEKLGLPQPLFQSLSVVGVQHRDPTKSPSISPSMAPSSSPSYTPSRMPSLLPTKAPSDSPSSRPSASPSSRPTGSPSQAPTRTPTKSPTIVPTRLPSASPSGRPSVAPSQLPSSVPSMQPSTTPTASKVPSSTPTVSLVPSKAPV